MKAVVWVKSRQWSIHGWVKQVWWERCVSCKTVSLCQRLYTILLAHTHSGRYGVNIIHLSQVTTHFIYKSFANSQSTNISYKVYLLFVKLLRVSYLKVKQVQLILIHGLKTVLTKPCFFSFLASSLLMCHSMEVSPQLISLQCQPVNTPRANVTAEHSMKTYITALCSDSEALSPLWWIFLSWNKMFSY